MNRFQWALIAGATFLIWIVAIEIEAGGGISRGSSNKPNKTERIEYRDPPPEHDEALADDILSEKHPAFDPALVDSRPIGDWEVNASAAVIGLDCPSIKPDIEKDLLVLRRSFAEAIRPAIIGKKNLLPSTNLVDGAAKQFDDGLYAALDLACYRGELGSTPAAPDWVVAVFQHVPRNSPARPFLAAALELAGKDMKLSAAEKALKDRMLAHFEENKAASKPISFYDWTPELKQAWRFYRFLQREFLSGKEAIPRDVAAVLNDHADLRQQYHAINVFYGRLTNPLICVPVDALIGESGDLKTLSKKLGCRRATVAVFPPSTSRHVELFDELFPDGLPTEANLMRTLILGIRSGKVDLKPQGKDGWFQYQAYALETMLLPARGQECDKLLLTARYKKRLIEAFKALMTKRIETHARQLGMGGGGMAMPLKDAEVRPRLRIEPSPSFYLRTARAYAFLQNFLVATVGRERLLKLHGLKQGGARNECLANELEAIRQRFYGFYLISCEDIGMKPDFLKDEPVDPAAVKAVALAWLKNMKSDPDLTCDTRVSVPIYCDQTVTRLWATFGVRLVLLKANYAKPPKVRPKEQGGEWQEVKGAQLGSMSYVIPVDEFAEFELRGAKSLTREEFRAICDRYKTKDEILKALSERKTGHH